MKAGENLFDKYHQWKKDRITLAFELSRFEGVSTDEVIESMCLSRPQDERVQTSGVSLSPTLEVKEMVFLPSKASVLKGFPISFLENVAAY